MSLKIGTEHSSRKNRDGVGCTSLPRWLSTDNLSGTIDLFSPSLDYERKQLEILTLLKIYSKTPTILGGITESLDRIAVSKFLIHIVILILELTSNRKARRQISDH